MYLWDKVKQFTSTVTQEVSNKFIPPPKQDVFHKSGELSPTQFTRAGDHLIKICSEWQWKPSLNPDYQSKYFEKYKQYLFLENNLCRKRINKKLKDKSIEQIEDFSMVEEDGIILLEGRVSEVQEKEKDNQEDFRYYKIYIIYDEYYHSPRMFFSATNYDGTPVSNDDIWQDVDKKYIGKTVTIKKFPFLENVQMPTVDPCGNAAFLKMISQTMVEDGIKTECHFALVILFKLFEKVIPFVEFDTTGHL